MTALSEMERLRRARERQFRRWQATILTVMALIAVAALWLLFHPEATGRYLGRIAAGFTSTGTRL